MPTYIYRCENCKKEKEVIHRMCEVDDPSTELIDETTCCERMVRVPQLTNYASFNTLTKDQKRDSLKKRATNHFNKEIKEKKSEMLKTIMKDKSVKPI